MQKIFGRFKFGILLATCIVLVPAFSFSQDLVQPGESNMTKRPGLKSVLSTWKGRIALIILLSLITITIAYADNPTTGQTTTGQNLNIFIQNPASGGTVNVCDQPLVVTGQTAIGELNQSANVSYIMDLSGSTTFVTNMDCNGDRVPGNAGDNFNGDSRNW